MTTPTIFSDVAANPFESKFKAQNVVAQKFVLSLPATTVADTNCGLIRFQPGFSLVGLSLVATDMDAEDDLLFDVGFLYDGTTGENDNAFFDNLTLGQAGGSIVWPVASGLLTGVSFVAADDGYLSLTTRANTVEVAGTVTGIATFTYDL